MTTEDGAYKSVPSSFPEMVATANNSMYTWFEHFDREIYHANTTTDDTLDLSSTPIVVPGPPVTNKKTYAINRIGDGKVLMSNQLYMWLYQDPYTFVTGATRDSGNYADNFRILIDYEMQEVTMEEIWIYQQNMNKYKPEALRWSIYDAQQGGTIMANEGTISAPQSIAPKVAPHPDRVNLTAASTS